MSSTPRSAREHLQSLAIEHASLSHTDVVTMSYTLHGWHITPRTSADASPIIARVWLLAALNTRGHYLAPERPEHQADLEDGDRLVDSVILMAIIQRHFLPRLQPGWDDATLAEDLGVRAHDVVRAQQILDDVQLLRCERHERRRSANTGGTQSQIHAASTTERPIAGSRNPTHK